MKNNFSAILGKNLIKISDISNNTRISRTTLTSIYYKRTKAISLEVLDKLCKYLGCTVGDIFEVETEERS